MGNFKVRVNNEAESKEVQELLVKMGYHARANWSERNPIHESIQAWSDGEFTFSLNHNQVPVGFKELTLPQLRAMVNPMKEYLAPDNDGYRIAVQDAGLPIAEDWIEIPDGMNYAYREGSFVQFTKQEMGYRDSVLVWQRAQSLNDQYAEIETVRQAIKVPDGNDSDHAADAMSYGFMGIKQDNVNNPQHYNKGGVECIDAIEASMTPEAFKGYLKGNVQKYMWRYEQKDGVESLRKAQWYLERLVASMDS